MAWGIPLQSNRGTGKADSPLTPSLSPPVGGRVPVSRPLSAGAAVDLWGFASSSWPPTSPVFKVWATLHSPRRRRLPEAPPLSSPRPLSGRSSAGSGPWRPAVAPLPPRGSDLGVLPGSPQQGRASGPCLSGFPASGATAALATARVDPALLVFPAVFGAVASAVATAVQPATGGVGCRLQRVVAGLWGPVRTRRVRAPPPVSRAPPRTLLGVPRCSTATRAPP